MAITITHKQSNGYSLKMEMTFDTLEEAMLFKEETLNSYPRSAYCTTIIINENNHTIDLSRALSCD
jgi:hypothetical protein